MKLSFLFSFMLYLTSLGSTFSQIELSLDLQDIPVTEFIRIIEEQTGFYFIYQDEVFNTNQKITIQAEKQSLESIVQKMAEQTSVDYKISNQQILILTRKNATTPQVTPVIKPQEEEIQQPRTRLITGTVTDTNGQPLIGATIIIKGTITGTITDINGEFSLTVPEDARILQFSYVGLGTQEKDIEGLISVYIELYEEVKEFDEIVVVGYGIQRKESVVGAISQTSGTDIRKTVQGSNLGNALTGHLPGLVTLQRSGIPGGYSEHTDVGYSEILIRGRSTWNESGPLVLVDGVERNLFNINPYEIEKISVLKDASATAVFGVKGANGVILITTLRGKEGKPVLTFDGSITGKTVSKIPHTLGSFEANLFRNYAVLNEVSVNPTSWLNITPQKYLEYYRDQTYPEYFPDIDWVDEMVKDWGFDKNINMTASGGTSFVKYFTSFSYLKEGDIMKSGDYGQGYTPNYEYDRLNFRSNLDFDITPSTRFSTNLSGYHSIKQTLDGGDRIWRGLNGRPPDLYPPRYSDGTWADYGGYDRFKNSLILFLFQDTRKMKATNINTDFQLNQKLDFITDGLSFKTKLAYDNTSHIRGPVIVGRDVPKKWINYNIVDVIKPGMTDEEIKELEKEYTIYMFPTGASSIYDYTDIPAGYHNEVSEENVYRSLYYELALNYGRDFGKHSVSGLFLMSRNQRATGSDFTSFREDWVGRTTYSYDRRYLFEVNAAYNGSEKFSKKYRFGFFPSMAVGWVLSNEPFFANYKSVVNNFKIRYSDGKVGSDAGIPRWLYTGSWVVTDYRWELGAPVPQPVYPSTFEGIVPNPDIHWEEAHKRNIGVETGFFNNMLSVNFDYFWEERTDIFLTASDRVVPIYFGAPPVPSNFGKVNVNGWELETRFSKTNARGLNVWAGFIWTYAKDKIIERGDPELTPYYQKQAGYQIGQTRISVNQPDGIMNSWNDVYTGVLPESNAQRLPGDFRIVDYNSDGMINADDAVPYGFPARPQYTYSPALGFSYKKLSASIRFFGIYNVRGETPRNTFYDSYNVVYPIDRYAWSPEFGNTDNARYAGLRLLTSGSSGSVFISRAYLKIQSADVSYSLSPPIIQKLGVSDIRFMLSGTNLYTWSDMTEDVDVNAPSGERYPLLRRVTFGMSFNF